MRESFNIVIHPPSENPKHPKCRDYEHTDFMPAGKIPEGHPALPAIPGFNIHALDLDHNHRGDSPVAQRAHTDHNNPTDCPEARV